MVFYQFMDLDKSFKLFVPLLFSKYFLVFSRMFYNSQKGSPPLTWSIHIQPAVANILQYLKCAKYFESVKVHSRTLYHFFASPDNDQSEVGEDVAISTLDSNSY